MSSKNCPDRLSSGRGDIFILQKRGGEGEGLIGAGCGQELQGCFLLSDVVRLLDDVAQIDGLVLRSQKTPTGSPVEGEKKEQESRYNKFGFHSKGF